MSSPLGWSAADCIERIKSFMPATKQRAMAKVAELANGQPVSDWDRDRVQQLAAYLHEIDPAREAGALQLAELKLTECQQVAAAAIAEYLDIEWPIDKAFAEPHQLAARDLILGAVTEHHDRLAQMWADVDRDEAKMRAAVIAALGLAGDGTSIDDALGSLTIDTADTTTDNDDEVDWEAISGQLLAELYRIRNDLIGTAGKFDHILSKLSDGVQDAITTVETMIPNEGDTTNE